MPLLGKKVFSCLKPLNDIEGEEAIFTIAHTREQFRSKVEFEKRKNLYEERIWTCQCTGHVNLTHEEAWNSEKAVQKTLKSQFATCYEKHVLEIIHHSTLSLDTLVDQTWLKLQQVLSLREKLNLRIKNAANAKTYSGIVVQIDSSGVLANPTSNCSSPSSDKENSSGEGKDSPKKWVPPKLLPYKYSIKLDDEDKVINCIPASDLVRVDHPPSKELLRLFIRASAIRMGTTATSPWVANDSYVKNYSLPSKFADFLLSPMKMAEAAKRAEEEGLKKRKHSSQHKLGSSKKLKISKSSSKTKRRKEKEKHKKEKEKSPRKKKMLSEVIAVESSSSDDEVLANLKSSNDSDSDTPLVVLKGQITPKKKRHSSSDSDSDKPLSQLSPKKKKLKLDSSSKKLKSPKKDTPKKRSPSKSGSQSGTKLSKDGTPKKRGRPRKDEATTPSGKKKTPTKKNMKQTTLLSMTGKKGSRSSPTKSARKTPHVPPTPMIIKKLMKMNRETDRDRIKYGKLLKKAAMTLTPVQKSNLPSGIKDVILKKCQQMTEKNLLDKMTPAEREAYMIEKRNKLKLQRIEGQKAKQKELRKRFEDLDLKLSPLPAPKLVPTPDGLPNECFGDIAMVTEFLTSYGGLLMPDEEYPIYSDAFMKALASGSKGFAYTSRVLIVLLQTLLQDEIAEGYKELKVKLSNVPVNPNTASELVRLCLRKHDSMDDPGVDVAADEEEEEPDEVSDSIVQQLETQEFHQLEPVAKLKVIRGLCLRILGTYSVQDYMESKQREANKLSREKYAEQKVMNVKLKEEKQKQKIKGEKCGDGEERPSTPTSVPEEKAKSWTLNHFYGKKEGETDSGSAANDSTDDADGLISTLKSRRIMAAKQAVEKEKREKEKKMQKEKEYQEYRKQMEKEKFDKTFKDGISLARSVLRQTPIGTDRNHCRYWIFNSTTPGLYIEKGWVNSDIEYTCQESSEGSRVPGTPKKSGSISGSQPNTPSKRRKKQDQETSFPHPGQNLWFTYDSVKDLDSLIKSLHPQGIRESYLRNEIKKKYDDICKAINLAKRTNNELRDCDGDEVVVDVFKKELIDTELRLRNGGLGGIPDFATWEAQVTSATNIKELGPCLKQVQMNVSEKFIKGFMKPPMPKQNVKEIKEEENNDDESFEEDTTATSKAVTLWFEAIDTCTTYSRLHVLLGMLESCIKWDKSAENSKCKICRKKGNDEAVLLCDECNQAFHMYCLRPALIYIPRGDWFCPACIPESKRRRCREVKRYNDSIDYDDGDDEEEEEEEIEHEGECAECGGDEGLVECATCPAVYHLECHNPPLRHPPRGRWECSDCKNGTHRKSRNRSRSRPGRRATKKKVAVESSSDEESDDGDEETAKPARSTQRKPPTKRSTFTGTGSRSRSSRRREPVDNSLDQKPVYSRRPPSELSIIEEILEKVMKHKCAWPFLEAVDKKEVPDYYQIVKHPMDLHTMKNKLVRLSYSSTEQVIRDTALVFRNCAQYNKEDSEVYSCMLEVEKTFVSILSKKMPFYHYSRDPVNNGYDDHGYSNRKRSRR